ncbi:phage tail protein [Streptomyces sp. NBC_00096]|uniref:phage tail protein n=1 Tax=Streptomyces sp. NBC_00096 TaxID=2975650 RepID=UPI003248ECC9
MADFSKTPAGAAAGGSAQGEWNTNKAMLGMAMRFKVEVGGLDLGHWSSCRGLNVSFEHDEVECGGNYEYNVLLPKRLKYGAVTLVRAIKADDTKKVEDWLRKVTKEWYAYELGGPEYPGTGMKITLMDAHNNPVYHWELRNVYPKNWKGPDLDSDANKVALETLELAHQGFL